MEDKDAYIRKLRKRKEEWNAEIGKLTAKADQAETESRDAFRKQLEDLQKKCKEAEQLHAGMWTADEGVLENLKSGVRDACDAMEAALGATRSRLS
jgi:chromosome condensin MukBEF ATPase and DNA-binding subunit MukB